MDSASSSRQSSKLSVADDKKRDKKHKKSSSSVDAKRETSSPNLNKELENKSDTAQTNSENVTDFLNDPSLQTGIKHNLVRSGMIIFEIVFIYSCCKRFIELVRAQLSERNSFANYISECPVEFVTIYSDRAEGNKPHLKY